MALLPRAAFAQADALIDIQRPGERAFVLDKANMIDAADEQTIKQIADRLLTDQAAPIIVCEGELCGPGVIPVKSTPSRRRARWRR